MVQRSVRPKLFAVAVLLAAMLPAASPRGQQPSVTALVGARVIDGTGGPPLENATIVVSGDSIQAIGPSAKVQVPGGASRVDVAGKTIIPGLINAHGHLSAGDEKLPIHDRIIAQLRVYADYGVTTVHSLGDDAAATVKVRDDRRDYSRDGARLFASGPSLTQLLKGKTIDDARKLVDLHADLKVNIIKIHVDGAPGDPNKLKPDMYRAIIDQAHKRGLRVASHLYYLDDARDLLQAGVDVIAHSIRDQDVDAAFVSEVRRRNVAYIPTLTRDLSVFVYETTPAFFTDPFFLRHADTYRRQVDQLKDPKLQAKTRASAETQRIKQALGQAQRNLKRLSDGGVTIAMGTDTGVQLGRWQGYFEHTELELMVQSGMSPMKVLTAATGDAARAMKLDARLGTLQTGKDADFVVLGANPITDIKNTQRIEAVWIGGRRVESKN
jgi:imidazolonepropionase-like amidohydrolase